MYQSKQAQHDVAAFKQHIATATTRTLHKHKHKINSIVYNSTNTLLATASTDTYITVYNTSDYSVHATLHEHKAAVDVLLWTASNTLISGSSDKTVKLYSFGHSTSRVQYTVHTVGENILLAYSDDAHIVAVGDKKNNITLIDTAKLHSGSNDGNKSAIVASRAFNNEINDIQLIYSHQLQCTLLLCATDLGTIDLYRTDNLSACVYAHTAHSTAIYTCCYMPQYNVFATGSADALVQLWSLDTLTNLCTYSRCESGISCISISSDSKLIAIGSEDKRIDISYVESGQHVHTIHTSAEVNSLQWSLHSGTYTLAYSDDSNDRNNIGKLYLFSFSTSKAVL